MCGPHRSICVWVMVLLGLHAPHQSECFSSSGSRQNGGKTPMTVISGFLGAGKTSLLQHLLHNEDGWKIGVIVNDMASINVDEKMLRTTSSSAMLPNSIVQLSNGCACCSRSEELLAGVSELVTLSDLTASPPFDHIVIEASGVSQPKSIRALFQEALFSDMPLMERVQLTAMVTVVDCSTFLTHLQDSNDIHTLLSTDNNKDEDDEWKKDLPPKLLEALQSAARTTASSTTTKETTVAIASLLVEQVEIADIVLLNKIDIVDDHHNVSQILTTVTALNPRATIYTTTHSAVPSIRHILEGPREDDEGRVTVVDAGIVDDHRDAVRSAETTRYPHPSATTHETHTTNSHRHDGDATCTDPTCTDATTHSHTHHHHSSVSPDGSSTFGGIGSYVYRARRPFHPGRLASFIKLLPVTRGIPTNHDNNKTNDDPTTTVKQQLLTNDGETEFDFLVQKDNVEKRSLSSLVRTCRNIVRSKGFVWLAHSSVASLYWSQAGSSFELQCVGRWWATLPRDQWPRDAIDLIRCDFIENDPLIGDRRQEIVFIGSGMERPSRREQICHALDQCLVTPSELQLYRQCCPDDNHDEDDSRVMLNDLFVNPFTIRMVDY